MPLPDMSVTGRFVITEHAPAVITLKKEMTRKEKKKKKKEEEEKEKGPETLGWTLKSRETFLGGGIISPSHLPETVDGKYALSAEITTFPPPFSFTALLLASPPARPDSLIKDEPPPPQCAVRDTNKSDEPTRAETTYSAAVATPCCMGFPGHR